MVVESAKEVGPALFFSLLIITVSFLPVFTLEGQEGRLFKPLAFTKTFAMAAASLLSVTLVPVAMGLFIRGRICRERANPVNRGLIAAYRPVIRGCCAHRWPVVGGRGAGRWSSPGFRGADRQRVHAAARRGHDPLHADHAARASASRGRARSCGSRTASSSRSPKSSTSGARPDAPTTATDPAGLDMFETTITLKPRGEWRPGMTYGAADRRDGLRGADARRHQRVDDADQGPHRHAGDRNSDAGRHQDVRARPGELERLGSEVEAVQMVPGTRSAFAERAVSGYYLDIDIDRAAAARTASTWATCRR